MTENIPKKAETSKTDVQPSIYRKAKKVYKIIVVGDSNVGKTCLTYRFCEGKMLTSPEATVGVDFRERTLNVGGEEIKLQLWDTAGQERFRKSMVAHYYRNAHAVIIVYDVTKLSTFQNVYVWLEECEKHNLTSSLPRILVGNKCDCGEAKVVSTNFAQRIADSFNMPLFETSALGEGEGGNIEGIFLTLAHKLVRQRPLMPVRALTMGPLEDEVNLHRAYLSISRSSDTTSSCGC